MSGSSDLLISMRATSLIDRCSNSTALLLSDQPLPALATGLGFEVTIVVYAGMPRMLTEFAHPAVEDGETDLPGRDAEDVVFAELIRQRRETGVFDCHAGVVEVGSARTVLHAAFDRTGGEGLGGRGAGGERKPEKRGTESGRKKSVGHLHGG